jgi:hypothetical protein
MAPKSAVIGSFLLFATSTVVLAQTSNPAEQPLGGNPAVRNDGASNAHERPGPLNPDPINPYGNAPARHDIRNPYFKEDNPYVTSTARPPHQGRVVNPAEIASQQQSGLTNADAKNLLQERGYTGINDLHADPSSAWVWQADGMKNGRRVRLGIDSHGNLLELGASTQPCTAPGVGIGAGPLGTGARISEANRCANR